MENAANETEMTMSLTADWDNKKELASMERDQESTPELSTRRQRDMNSISEASGHVERVNQHRQKRLRK